MKLDQRGSTSFALFGLAILLGLIAFWWYITHLPGKYDVPKDRAAMTAATWEQKVYGLQGDLYRLYTSLDAYEAMRNRRKYLQILQSAERKLIQMDDLWEDKVRSQQAVFDGMRSGLNEYYETRFTSDEKFAMLARKFGVPQSKLRRLKADIEIMFSEEFADKFGANDENDGTDDGDDAAPADETTAEDGGKNP